MSLQFFTLRKAADRGQQGERGQTLVLFLLMMVILFVFVGMGVDLGFAYITKARLSKAVDSAALSGMRNVNQGTAAATVIAQSAFSANYGTSGRDVAAPAVTIAFGSTNGNTVINVNATVAINTYFIRVLPTMGVASQNWRTLTVHSAAQATRSTLIMALVLDRSFSMTQNGGSGALPPAVTNFIALFDDQTDYASQVSFSSAASVDVAMQQPFISKIQSAALALNFNGDTCSDEGLTNGMAQIELETNVTAQSIVRVMVFFTDGMANSFNYVFNCGDRDIGYNGPVLFDPVTGNSANTGCTIPPFLSSISPTTGQLTPNAVDTTSCSALHLEAENRAEWIAYQARAQEYTIYAIGMGNPSSTGECGFPVVNPAFLENLANTSGNYGQPVGDFALAEDASQLNEVFQTIAAKILLRLSR